MFDVFAQFARSRARSVAFCNLKNKSSLVIPNCDFACNGDTEAAAAIHTAKINAVQEFWFGLPISTCIQNRSNRRLKEGMCNTCAMGSTASKYRWKSASTSILVGNFGALISLLLCADMEPPRSRFNAGASDGICSADNSADDCDRLWPATDEIEALRSERSLPSYT